MLWGYRECVATQRERGGGKEESKVEFSGRQQQPAFSSRVLAGF